MMAEDGVTAEDSDFAEVWQRACDGDQDAQADLWLEYRPRMHHVIRLKAADLRLEWAVDPDDIYDSCFVKLFTRRHSFSFENAQHFANYVEKSVRRFTTRSLRADKSRYEISLTARTDIATFGGVVEELIWQEEMEAARTALTRREKAICTLVKAGYTWREVGQHLSLAADTVRMVHRRAVNRIREEFLGGVTRAT